MSETVMPPVLLRRHVLAAVMGNALEFYDFLTYAFFSVQIGHAFFPNSGAYGSLMLSLALFMAGFATRPLGALILGNLADRRGRRPAMMISYLLMGSAILLMALIPPYSVIGMAAPIVAVAARMAQGFSLGGEVGSNSAFLAEAAAPSQRALMISWQGASQQIAGVMGSLVGVGLASLLAPALFDAWGWRIAFLLGGATLPLGVWLRRGLPETLHAPDQMAATAPAPSSEARLRTAARYAALLALGVVIIAGGSIGTYVLTYIPTYAQNTLHMRAVSGLWSEVAIYGVSFGACLFGGWLSDRIGRRPVMIWTNLAFLLLIWPMFAWVSAVRSPVILIVAPTILAVCSSLPAGAIYAMIAEGLPKSIRGAGFALVYSTAVAIAGGSTQFVITWLIHATGSPLAPAWYLIGATALAQVAIAFVPETAPCRAPAVRGLAPVPA
ncbi:MAG TPA: MFS transporter [Caulobacteraceae bacterium]|jgi:MFS family permease|nr:MFS transporter [Caulobacteraceae bacterium]